MVYIIFSVVVVLCIVVVIFARKVIKENRTLSPGMDEDDDDEFQFRG